MDVKKIVKRDFDQSYHKLVLDKLQEILSQEWGVGKEQLVKSILQLSKGSISKFKKMVEIIDPRDIIMSAQNESEDKKSNYR